MAATPDGKDTAETLKNDTNDGASTQRSDRLPSGGDTETGQMSVDTSALGGGTLAEPSAPGSDETGPDIDGGSR